jgi:beta-lactamase regulating signal transducer with metallopeptidase domain
VDRLLQIALTNALTATLLALPAAGLSRLLRKPPVTRALWILVLLKLLTPPIWSVPLWWHTGEAASRQAETSAPSGANQAAVIGDSPDQTASADDEPLAEDSGATLAPPAPPTDRSRISIPRWSTLLAIAWASGCVVYLAMIFVSVWRVGRLARRSRPAPPSLETRVQKLAGGLGLRRSPSVAFVDRLVPPMLCPLGVTPRILIPDQLWHRLDENQQNTVLAHELAHLRARDHWMRTLELIAAVLYWWHPLVWWSRHELREAAEQCCDACVVSSMPWLARSYAAALVEAIEFISSAPAAVPALASTMGQFTDLRRRLVMIKQGNAMRSLTRPALAAIFSAAGFVLPLSPSFAQEAAPRAPEAPVAITVAPAPEVQVAPAAPTAPVAIEVAADDPTDPAPQPKMHFQFRTLSSAEADSSDGARSADRAEYEKARAEVASLRAQLRAAERRLAALEKPRGKRETRYAPGDIEAKPKAGAMPKTPPTPSYVPMKRNFNADQNDAFAKASERLRAASDQLNEARDRSRQTLERRLDAMERQMSEISNQLRQLRRQMSDQPTPERRTR